MQKVEKISPRTSLVVMAPVMVPREERAVRRSSARRSVGRLESRPERTAEREVATSRRAAAWRALVTKVPVEEVIPVLETRVERKESRPKPVLAEIVSTGP